MTFTELYSREFQPLVRLATLMTGRVEIARDIVQDAFVKLHVKWPGVRDPAAYVRRSVVNGCRSHHRWERRRRGRSTADEPSVDLAVDHTLAALERLPHKQRAALVMKFYEGRTETRDRRRPRLPPRLGRPDGPAGARAHASLAARLNRPA